MPNNKRQEEARQSAEAIVTSILGKYSYQPAGDIEWIKFVDLITEALLNFASKDRKKRRK